MGAQQMLLSQGFDQKPTTFGESCGSSTRYVLLRNVV